MSLNKTSIIESQELQEGVILVQYSSDTTCCQPIHGSRHILDIRYNLISKFKIADHAVSKMKISIKNLFSHKDILLIKEIIEIKNFSNDIKSFLNKIIDYNLICYTNSCHKNITQILSDLHGIEKYNTKENLYFNKYISLSNLAKEKISTVLNDKIYMSMPREFNDRFDCQLHIHSYKQVFGSINVNPDVIQDICVLLGCGVHIYSFSLNDSESIESNHMWGLYADNGRGVAIKYKLTDLSKIIYENNFKNTDIYQNIMVTNVIYGDNYNPLINLRKLAESNNYDSNSMIDFFNLMVRHKSKHWEHEREVRLYKYSFDKLLPYFENKKNVALGKLSQVEFEKISYVGVDNQPRFLKPCKIILGWNCDEADQNIQELLTYAKINGIEAIKLDRCIDYLNNKFFILNM